MIKLYIGVLALGLTFSPWAYADNLKFENIKLSELVKVTFGEITKSQFVTDDALNNDLQLITINLQDNNKTQIHSVMQNMLQMSGYDLQKKEGVYYIKKRSETDLNAHVEDLPFHLYEPKHRTIKELNLLLKSAFPQLAVGLGNPKITSTTKDAGNNSLQDQGTENQLNNDFLIFRTQNNKAEKITDFLTLIDKPVRQLQIVAASYEVSNINDSQRGVDIVANLFKSLSLGVVTTGGSNVLKITGTNLTAAFKFMDTDNRFKSISKPTVRVKSGGRVSFNSGQDVPVLGAVVTNQGVQTQSIEYKKSGVLMDIEALSMASTIDLKVRQEFSTFIATKTGLNNTPTLNKRLIETELNMNDGEIVVIGGITDQSSSDNTGSFLGLFPIDKSKNMRELETIIIMQVSKI